jgi:hypothetical protein
LVAIVLTLSLSGCDKKSGATVVLEKEHIAAREMSAASNTLLRRRPNL